MATAFSVVMLALASHAEPYVTLRGGPAYWPDRSNGDAIESGTEAGSFVALAIGDEAGLSDIGLPKSDFALDLEIEGAWRHHPLHGRNGGTEHHTADGRELELWTLTAAAYPGWQVTRWLTISAGGGAGVAFARALSDSERGWVATAGGSLRVNVTPELSFDVGARAAWVERMRLGGYSARVDAVGPVAGIRYEWR